MISRFYFVILLLHCINFFSCTKQDHQFTQFEKTAQNDLQNSQEEYPLHSIAVLKNLKKREQAYLELKKRLNQFEYDKLNQTNQALFKQLHQKIVQAQGKLTPFFEDPSLYNLGGILKEILADSQLNLEEKLQRIEQTLSKSSSYYELAKENLVRPKAEKIELAVQKQILSINFLFSELSDSITHSKIEKEMLQRLEREKTTTKLVLKDYIAYCESLYFEHRDSTLN